MSALDRARELGLLEPEAEPDGRGMGKLTALRIVAGKDHSDQKALDEARKRARPQYIVSLLMGVCTIATAGLFFTKLLVNWPRLPGLDLTNGRRR